MATVAEGGVAGLLLLPAAVVTADCVDNNPAGSYTTYCVRRLCHDDDNNESKTDS